MVIKAANGKKRLVMMTYRFAFDNPILFIDPSGNNETHYYTEGGEEIVNTNDGKNDGVVVSKNDEKMFRETVKNTPEANLNDKTFNENWSNYLVGNGGTKLSENQVNMLGGLDTDWSRGKAIDFWKNPSISNGAAFFFSAALSQWTDSQKVIGGLAAGVAGYEALPAKGAPKSSPNFRTPTTPPQMAPEAPNGYNVRVMPPTADYPHGYWVMGKPMTQGGAQKVNPSTMKPGPEWDTHVPLPPK